MDYGIYNPLEKYYRYPCSLRAVPIVYRFPRVSKPIVHCITLYVVARISASMSKPSLYDHGLSNTVCLSVCQSHQCKLYQECAKECHASHTVVEHHFS